MLLHLGARPGLSVVGESEIQVLLAHEKDKTVLKCESDERCLKNLKAAIDAKKVVTGHLGKMGAGLVVTLKLADASRAVVERGEAAQADTPAELEAELKRGLDRLFGSKPAVNGVSRWRLRPKARRRR